MWSDDCCDVFAVECDVPEDASGDRNEDPAVIVLVDLENAV